MSSAIHLHQPEEAHASSLTEKAYFRLRELIVSLELPPGSIVVEREVMQKLGLGRTPVRDALRQLAQEGLVEVYPRRGIVVSAVNVHDLRSISELREVIEAYAAGLAARRATPEERALMDGLLAELADAAGERDERRLIELDQRIHRLIYRCTHNPFLGRTLNEHYTLALRIWFLALGRVGRLDAAVLEHRDLLRAIRDGDSRRAERAMRAHVSAFEQAIREVL